MARIDAKCVYYHFISLVFLLLSECYGSDICVRMDFCEECIIITVKAICYCVNHSSLFSLFKLNIVSLCVCMCAFGALQFIIDAPPSPSIFATFIFLANHNANANEKISVLSRKIEIQKEKKRKKNEENDYFMAAKPTDNSMEKCT